LNIEHTDCRAAGSGECVRRLLWQECGWRKDPASWIFALAWSESIAEPRGEGRWLPTDRRTCRQKRAASDRGIMDFLCPTG